MGVPALRVAVDLPHQDFPRLGKLKGGWRGGVGFRSTPLFVQRNLNTGPFRYNDTSWSDNPVTVTVFWSQKELPYTENQRIYSNIRLKCLPAVSL